MKKWILYNFIVGFAVYWASNLLLWFPWSINTWFGITLMLTVSPILWVFSTFLCLRTFPKEKLINGAILNSIIFLLLAVIMDYIFFGLIRNAMEQLYHPTTFYGYGFLVGLPFIGILGFRKKIEQNKRNIHNPDFIKAGTIGLICFGLLTLIIIYKIKL